MKLIIFTDLDSTLLDHNTYSFEEARPALRLIKEEDVPLILCTSKTFAETQHYQEILGINHPFIVEDGGAIYIPKNYFGFGFEHNEKKGFLIIELGTPYNSLRKALMEIREELKKPLVGFGDMSHEEIARETGLSMEQAGRAAEREYDEPFRFEGDEDKLKELVKRKDLRLSKGGRYYHITGKNDKGEAVALLSNFFKRKYGKEQVITIGIGDSENDFAMLDQVDEAYLVQRADKSYASENYIKAEDIGPKGWNKVVETKIKEIFKLDKKR